MNPELGSAAANVDRANGSAIKVHRAGEREAVGTHAALCLRRAVNPIVTAGVVLRLGGGEWHVLEAVVLQLTGDGALARANGAPCSAAAGAATAGSAGSRAAGTRSRTARTPAAASAAATPLNVEGVAFTAALLSSI